ncbi:MAG: cysteine desulfurase family protein [Planctomycetota bacterium]
MTIYLDHNATTPLRPEVRELLGELAEEQLGNPSSLHASGRRARHRIDEARARTAHALGVGEDEILFTSGGTESNNLALAGVLGAAGAPAGLVTTAVEHSAVLAPARALEARGHRLRVVPVDAAGRVDAAEVARAAEDVEAALVSVQAANNEIGVLQPLPEIAAALGKTRVRPLLHADAVQALGRTPLELRASGVDLASFSAHKVGGPLGVGVLYRRGGVALTPLLFGGEHEAGVRPGTENAAGIAAAALAIELAVRECDNYIATVGTRTRSLWQELASRLPALRLLGPPIDASDRLSNTLAIAAATSQQHDGKVLVTRLDLEGLQVSAGSACASGSVEPSHVLLALGLDDNEARAGIRLSLGRTTSNDECKRAVDILVKVLSASRAT